MIAARCALVADNELAVAIACWLLSVGREEIGPARHEISADVLDDDGDAVRFGIDRAKEIIIDDLGERAFSQLPLALEREKRVLEDGSAHESVLVDIGSAPGWVKMRLRRIIFSVQIASVVA